MIRRALIIDDDSDARALVATVLRDVMPGIRVSEVSSAVALPGALDHPDLWVAVVARDLAWADGLDLIKLLRQRHPSCASILLGALSADQSDPQAQPDAHLSRSLGGLASLGQVVLLAVERRARARHPGIAALDGLPVAVIELSADERVLSANSRAAALFGHEHARALVGWALGDLVSATERDRPERGTGTLVSAAAAAREGVAVLVGPATGAPMECRLLVRAATEGGVITGFTAVLVPGSEAQGQRTVDLLYAVSHDLQQPLATASRSAEMLSERLSAQGRLDEQAQRLLRHVLSSTARMDDLMSGLLDYVRTSHNPVRREPVDLGAVCEEVVRGLQARVEETGGVVRWAELPIIEASRPEIARLLENLIGNALKFYGSETPTVAIECADREDSWLLSVRDNGIGINQSDAERIFQPFQRLHTESDYPGTGIGLAICRQIAERHGGRIWVTENPEGGSTFFVTIQKNN